MRGRGPFKNHGYLTQREEREKPRGHDGCVQVLNEMLKLSQNTEPCKDFGWRTGPPVACLVQ